ncbi:MAG: hypothetical protein JSV23_10305 [Promethearchaeota archaeon]|nr:MAG: hypothetical protein JSV23_10305 [Candidatus Lokiarchaeota archaeon]
MEKVNQFIDKLFNFVPGYVFGFLTFFILFLGDIIALILSPEYYMWESSISVLGLHSGGVYLRLGLIVSGLTSIPFMIYLGRILKSENAKEYLVKITVITGIFYSICATCTGIFTGVNVVIDFVHGIFALFSWIGKAVFCTLLSILMLKDSRFSKLQIYLSFIVAGIFFCYLIPFFITVFCAIYASICYELGETIYLIMPVFEWILMFSVIFWYLINSSYIAYKKI